MRSIISIHALRGEGDDSSSNSELNIFISIHALRGEGDNRHDNDSNRKSISIHALRGEGDIVGLAVKIFNKVFQSTPSVGRATPSARGTAIKAIFQSTPSVGRATI